MTRRDGQNSDVKRWIKGEGKKREEKGRQEGREDKKIREGQGLEENKQELGVRDERFYTLHSFWNGL